MGGENTGKEAEVYRSLLCQVPFLICLTGKLLPTLLAPVQRPPTLGSLPSFTLQLVALALCFMCCLPHWEVPHWNRSWSSLSTGLGPTEGASAERAQQTHTGELSLCHPGQRRPHPVGFSSSSSAPFSLLSFFLRTCLLPPRPVVHPVLSSFFSRPLSPASCAAQGQEAAVPQEAYRGSCCATCGAVRLRRALPVRSGGRKRPGSRGEWTPSPVGECLGPGRGGRRAHPSPTPGLVSESGSAARAAACPTAAASPPHPRSPPPSPLSVRWREGPPHPQPTQRGGVTKHKRTAEDPLDTLGLLQGPAGFKMGTRQPRPRA